MKTIFKLKSIYFFHNSGPLIIFTNYPGFFISFIYMHTYPVHLNISTQYPNSIYPVVARYHGYCNLPISQGRKSTETHIFISCQTRCQERKFCHTLQVTRPTSVFPDWKISGLLLLPKTNRQSYSEKKEIRLVYFLHSYFLRLITIFSFFQCRFSSTNIKIFFFSWKKIYNKIYYFLGSVNQSWLKQRQAGPLS